ncbi:inner membrane protein [Nakamurella sp. UYEF19]|uniref:metal-dependent hydrolase n=1 Tax=Nakamurella sp. UYEF19 TaxID=1756392 RepID=UPI003391A8D0
MNGRADTGDESLATPAPDVSASEPITRRFQAANAGAEWLARTTRWVWSPCVLVLLIVALDLAQNARRWSVPISGLLDEPAHLSTSALVLLAIAGPRWLQRNPFATFSALIASMAVDIDHIPLYAGLPHIADGGRPYSHSLFTVGVLAVIALLVRGRRALVGGLAIGVLLHFVRDISTGPGLILLWPFDFETVRLPYELYLWVLVFAAAVATTRILMHALPARPGR